MAITGSQKAQLYAMAGVARAGTTRSDATTARWFVSIGGTQRRTSVVQGTLVIEDALNEEPNRLLMSLVGLSPTKGQEVVVTLGSVNNVARIFAGQILSIRTRYDGRLDNIVRDVQASDYTYLLDRKVVRKQYTSTSATTIAKDLIDTFTSGFTYTHIASGLASVDEISFTDETVSGALTRLANRIGGYWYVDYHKDVHLWTGTETGITNPTTITSTLVAPAFRDLTWDDDLTRVITRVYVEGNGSPAALDAAAGATILAVNDLTFFNAAGGTVVSGRQRVTYTGVTASSVTGSVADHFVPTSAPTLANNNNNGGVLTVGATYRIAVTFVSTNGESHPSPASSGVVAVTDGAGGSKQMTADSIPLGPTGTTSRGIYRTLANGSVYYLEQTIADNTTTTILNVGAVSDATLAARALAPVVSTGGPDRAVGSTSLTVGDISVFSATGGFALVAHQIIRYTGRSASSGIGSLTGIPSSGIGSIVSVIPTGTAVTTQPALTGIPASGTGSIQYAIAEGDDINLLITVNDAAAQTALAALVGGDGIQEATLQDRRLSETEATARGTAYLALKSDPVVSTRYRTRDKNTVSGRTVTITSVNGLTGTLRIQRARWTGFGEGDGNWPTLEVEASSVKFSLQDLLRQVRAQVEGIPS